MFVEKIRVSQQLADSNWGFQFIPRVVSEVIISFLPRSIGQKSEQQSNELQFNDTKDAEQLNIHAGKDYENTVNKSMTANIHKNNTEKINNDRKIFSQKDHITIVNKQINIKAGTGAITINPDSITLQAPRISLGIPGAGGAALVAGAPGAFGRKNKDKTADQPEEDFYPSVEVKIDNCVAKLPPVSLRPSPYKLTAKNSLDAILKVGSKKLVNKTTFDEVGFKKEVIRETCKVFSNLKIQNPSSVLKENSITLYNDYGEYNFALSATIITENEQQYTGTLSKDESIKDDDWIITGEIDMNLTVNLSKDQEQGLMPKTLVYDLQYNPERVRNALASLAKSAELVFLNASPFVRFFMIAGAVILSPVIIALATA